MIITITFNPSIDSIYSLEHFLVEGDHNRVDNPLRMIGGKGINASRVLMQLGVHVIPLTISGGANGVFMKQKLIEENIHPIFFPISGDIRNSITLMNNGVQTELVEKGPNIPNEVIEQMLQTIQQLVNQYSISVISINGSIISDDELVYNKFLSKLNQLIKPGTKIVMDVSQHLLANLFNNEIFPYCIKPNKKELSELLQTELTTKSQIIKVLSYPKFNSIPFILVSLGKDGAIAKVDDAIYTIEIPTIKVVNPTGSGDAVVAGICYSIEKNLDIISTLKYAMACGMSNAMHKEIGYISLVQVEKLLEEITITTVNLSTASS